jgi:fatty-acyl-CoA synthase
MGNRPDYVFTLFGAAMIGATVVGINATRRGAELQRDIEHTDCQLVISDAKHLELLRGIGVQTHNIDDETFISELVGHAERGVPEDLPDPDSLFVLIFTSGSTAAPKAVKRSQRRIAHGNDLGFTDADILYSAMPLSHGNGLFGNLIPALQTGACMVLKERFSASELMPEVRKHKVTYFNTVGRALSYVLATPTDPLDREHRVRWVLAPEASQRDATEFFERFGTRAMSGYGSSESAIAMSPCPEPGAMGRAREDQDVVVVSTETLQECPTAVFDEGGVLLNSEEAIGEVVRRDGYAGIEGYYNNDEATHERTRNGWYHSGDLAYRDANGVFYFAGRLGDWIRVDAENFATAPIERIIGRHPQVAAVGVYAVPDTRNGDQVMAAIEPRADEQLDVAELKRWLEGQTDLGTKWMPRYLRLSKALPSTGNDKLDKRPLKAEGWRTADRILWQPTRNSDYVELTEQDKQELERELTTHGRGHLIPGGHH